MSAVSFVFWKTEFLLIILIDFFRQIKQQITYIGHRKPSSYQGVPRWKNTRKYAISGYIVHKNYIYGIEYAEYDIAILILEGSGVRYISTEDLPHINTLPLKKLVDTELIILGYGLTEKHDVSEKLLGMTGKIFDKKYEDQIPSYCYRRTKLFCYRGIGEYQTSNKGDSGGPVIFQKTKPDKTIETTLVGIIKGHKTFSRLPQKNIGYVTNVAFHKRWIEYIISQGSRFPSINQTESQIERCCKEFYD